MFQDNSLDFKLVQRICLLQQALDQAMESLEDLQQQVSNHQMLQSHLAQTEEYSNVQQKIILNLQQQLEAKDQWQHQVLEKLLLQVKRLVDDQHLELERLRVRIYQGQAEVQDYLVRIKNHYQNLSFNRSPAQDLDPISEVMIARALTVSLSSQLQAAQQHIQQLDGTLTRHQVTLARMQAYVRAVNAPAAKALAPAHPQTSEAPEDAIALRAIVEAQRQKMAELIAELGQQFHQQTHLKSRFQEIAAERDTLKQREVALRQENKALYEQMVQQSNQISDYEATLRDWEARWLELNAQRTWIEAEASA
ncbi:MAG: hypothetical protein ACFCVD_13120 [Nodosilinea sp.]